MSYKQLPVFIEILPDKLAESILKVVQDICPKCGGELDTGWECNDCGGDAQVFLYPGKYQ